MIKTVAKAKNRIEELADEIDEYLGELERNNKDKGKNYETLLYIAGALRDLLEVEFD